MHNIIAWIKNKPFLSKRVSYFYIGTVLLSIPYWILEIYANFTFFNNINNLFHYTRPYEAIFRDPWWIFTVCNLFWNIIRRYEFSLIELVRVSPRFGVLLVSMLMSLGFIIVDICSVTGELNSSLPQGINPFWKLAFIFKCLTDTIILDDFKTALDKLKEYRLQRMNSLPYSVGSDNEHGQQRPRLSRAMSSPYNESKGVTETEKHLPRNPFHRNHERTDSTRNNSQSTQGNDQGQHDFNHIDLEMQYWATHESARNQQTRPYG